MANPKQAEEEAILFPGTLEECQAKLIETRKEVEELKDRFLRAAAQIENIRKWTERDILARIKEDQRKQFRQFLEVVDNLERALAQPAEVEALAQGVRLILRQLEKALAQAGVERIPVEPGDPFDPTVHEALKVQPGDVDGPAIEDVVRPGYLLEKDLLRPAGVVVRMPVD